MTQSTIKEITRLQNSKNGNPRFHIIMEDGTEGATKADAGWAYSIDPWGWKGKKVNYEWKKYKSGYRVFDSVKVYSDIENLKETIENLISLHEMQAPLEDIDAAIIEARCVLNNLEN